MPRRERRRSHPTLDPGAAAGGLATGGLGCQSNGALNTPRGQRSEGIDELIHFVRNCQGGGGGLRRETTEMRLLLQRKAPLPDIGHTNGAYPPGLAPAPLAGHYQHHPPSLLHGSDHATSSSLDTETTDTDHAYESDLEPELEFPQRVCTPSPPPLPTAVNPLPPAAAAADCRPAAAAADCRPASVLGKGCHNPARLSKSLEGIPESAPLNRTKLRPLYKPGAEPPGARRAAAGVHHLPPVVLDQPERPAAPGLSPRGGRGGGPGRPTAPSPSVTPPLPDEASESTPVVAEEPIDYLDLH